MHLVGPDGRTSAIHIPDGRTGPDLLQVFNSGHKSQTKYNLYNFQIKNNPKFKILSHKIH